MKNILWQSRLHVPNTNIERKIMTATKDVSSKQSCTGRLLYNKTPTQSQKIICIHNFNDYAQDCSKVVGLGVFLLIFLIKLKLRLKYLFINRINKTVILTMFLAW